MINVFLTIIKYNYQNIITMTIIIICTMTILVIICYPKMAESSPRSINTLKRLRGSRETTKTMTTVKYYYEHLKILISTKYCIICILCIIFREYDHCIFMIICHDENLARSLLLVFGKYQYQQNIIFLEYWTPLTRSEQVVGPQPRPALSSFFSPLTSCFWEILYHMYYILTLRILKTQACSLLLLLSFDWVGARREAFAVSWWTTCWSWSFYRGLMFTIPVNSGMGKA